MSDPVIPFDLQRMFLGTEPWPFYLEIMVRCLIIYAYALILLRWLGGRTVGQLSTVEFLLVIALGSAVGDPMFYPEVPVFHAMAVITIVVLCDKGLDIIVARTTRGEKTINGEPVEVIRDGVINYHVLHRAELGQNEFFRQLRRSGFSNTGQVGQAFLETNGELSVFRRKPEQDGLAIVPPWEIVEPETLHTGTITARKQRLACQRCAQTLSVKAGDRIPPCPHCHYPRFSEARPPDAQ